MIARPPVSSSNVNSPQRAPFHKLWTYEPRGEYRDSLKFHSRVPPSRIARLTGLRRPPHLARVVSSPGREKALSRGTQGVALR